MPDDELYAGEDDPRGFTRPPTSAEYEDILGLAKTSPATSGASNGGVDPVDNLINKALEQYRSASQTTGWERFFGGFAREKQALQTLQNILPLQRENRAAGTAQLQAQAELRKAQAQHMGEVRNFMQLFREEKKDYFSQSEDVQKATRPGRIKIWQMAGKVLGLDPRDIEAGFTDPHFVDQAMALVDPIVQNSPALAAHARQSWGTAKPGEERRKVAEDIDQRARVVADGMIRQAIPQMLQSAGRGPLNPVSPEDLRQAFGNLPGEYSKSLILQEQLDGFLADPKNEVALQRIGVETSAVAAAAKKEGAIEAAKVKAHGPKLPSDIAGQLATQPNALGEPLTPAQATTGQIAGAIARAHQQRVEVSAAQGAGAVTAKATAEADLPLYQTRREGQHIIDLKQDREVDYFVTRGKDLEKDSTRYRELGAEAFKQYTALKEMEGLFSEFERIAPQLVKQPGMNKLQQVEFWAKRNLGVPGIQTDLDTLKGTTLRVARAMQNSAQALSDMDRKTVEGMLPTAADTADSALRRLAQTYRILGHMKGAILGQSRAEEKVKEAIGAPTIKNPKLVR